MDPTAVDLGAKIAYLRALTAFDHVVDCIETHMSWVFLTGPRAFKLKKPVRLPYLDHSTVARRQRACENELRLGRRLAPDVYLGVVPLVATPEGLALGDDAVGQGTIVDWLVVMRRVPAARMLPEMLAHGEATLAHADALGDVLSRFYRAATPARWGGASYRRHLRDWITGVGRELVDRGAPRARVTRLVHAQLAAVTHTASILDARVAVGRVVDAHGDLRPEHVCLESPPVVIDPLEFSDELRLLDAASELAFFALECERLGATWFADRVVARYCTDTGDRIPAAVAALYRSQHALTRALIGLRHLDDAALVDHPRWRARAADYLARAELVPSAVTVRAPA